MYRYDAFGNRLDSNTALTSLLYSGEQTDGTGLQYLRARYYDPNTGRFNRLDPFAGSVRDPLSLHKYLYSHGDPIRYVDPSGGFSVPITTAIVGVGLGMFVGWSLNGGFWGTVGGGAVGGLLGYVAPMIPGGGLTGAGSVRGYRYLGALMAGGAESVRLKEQAFLKKKTTPPTPTELNVITRATTLVGNASGFIAYENAICTF